MNRIGPILFGLLVIILGTAITLDPTVYNPILEYSFDFAGYNIPLGIFMIIIGLGFVWTSFRGKSRR